MKHFIFILIASTFLYSCESFFNSVTDVDIESHDSKLAVFGYMDGSGNTQTITVGTSKGYIESGEPEEISGATVLLTRNGTEVMDFYEDSPGFYAWDVPLDLQRGDQLRLDVSAPNFDPVYATTTVTPLVDLVSIEYDGEIFSLEYGEPLPQYEITFNDNGDTDDYYFLEVYSVDGLGNRRRIEVASNEVNISYWTYLGLVLDDNTFNGNQHKLDIFIYDYEGFMNEGSYQLDIKTISKEMYRYAKSRTAYWNSDGNPFAEPVTVTSNIEEDAFGIFGVMRSQKYDFPE
ncbi:MAG: hypothetical protein ACI94Y_004004 [Maribacter sp.]|jgi:hypothetical protein